MGDSFVSIIIKSNSKLLIDNKTLSIINLVNKLATLIVLMLIFKVLTIEELSEETRFVVSIILSITYSLDNK